MIVVDRVTTLFRLKYLHVERRDLFLISGLYYLCVLEKNCYQVDIGGYKLKYYDSFYCEIWCLIGGRISFL